MKKFVILAVVAVMAALFVPATAMAKIGPLKLSASGTILLQGSGATFTSSKTNIESTSTFSFNEKYIYNVISNAVARTNYPYLTPTHLPADGYIAFDATNGAIQDNVDGSDFYYQGLFYVTNKEGFYLPLN